MSNPTEGPEATVVSSGPVDQSAATDPAAAGDATAAAAAPSAVPGVNATPTGTYSGPDPELKNAKGDPHAWSGELAAMIGHTTGTWIDPDTFVPWFQTYSDQVKVTDARSIAFDIANMTIQEAIDGDAGTLLLDLRNDISYKVRKRVGLA